MNQPTLRSAMTAHPHSIRVDETVAHARKMMSQLGVRHLPVLKAGALVGVLSDRDLKLIFGDDTRVSVEDACVDSVVTVDVDTSLHAVARAMAEKRVGSVLVTENGALCGIFTTTDACRVLAEISAPVDGAVTRGGVAW